MALLPKPLISFEEEVGINAVLVQYIKRLKSDQNTFVTSGTANIQIHVIFSTISADI